MSEQKRLIRSTTDRVVGGVAGGLARYLEIDPTFVRLAFVVLALFNGVGALIYFIMWLVIPDEQSRELTGESVVQANFDDMKGQAERIGERFRGGRRNGEIIGILLVGAGLIFLLRQFVPAISMGIIWPVILIGIGAYLLVTRR